ncbi:MAG: DUF192 domain-containing protein [Microbacteriaceae bacterium]|nr:DUF192 domain-containing protein [Burkholderiaceae bacterium]
MIQIKRLRPARYARLVQGGLLAVVLLFNGGRSQAQPAAEGPQRLQAITLNAGMHNILAEVALTPAQRQKGLMHRRDLASHEGMLFVFDEATPQCFWMKNTPTPLTIAFLADDGRIVNLADMKPFDEASHCSSKPVRLVLEMNQGWFAKRGILPGFKLLGPPFKP